ncbi:hypothetical protein C8R46DRAFT_1036082 [Mycena filopes]|nr:hypothetical protein C8R46DRAFT_1036082 [Mycena filopes]
MPRRSTTTEIRVNDITGCLMITASTLDVLVNTLGISDLGPVSNTIQSVLKLAQTIKQEKNECAEMMEKTNILLTAVIGAYISSDTGLDLAPTVLSQIAKFTE